MSDLISRADLFNALATVKAPPEANEYKAEVYTVIQELPSADGDLISRAKAKARFTDELFEPSGKTAQEILDEVPSAEAVQGWIPVSEGLPKELEAVNVTWVNHNPPVYYQNTKDVPKADTAVHYKGVWYWWDPTICDVLAEYGEECGAEPIDKDIEVLAWQPLPTPYKGGEDE